MNDAKQYQDILNDLIASKGPNGPIKNLVRKGMPEAKARTLVYAVYKDLKWEMRKVHLWKVLGSGALLAVFGLIAVFSGRVFFIIIALAGLAFVYSLFQFVFAVGSMSASERWSPCPQSACVQACHVPDACWRIRATLGEGPVMNPFHSLRHPLLPMLALGWLMCLGSVAASAAELPADKVAEYFALAHTEERYQHGLDRYYSETAKHYPSLVNVKTEYLQLLARMWPFDRYRETVVQSMADKLTPDDLETLLVFVRTDAGKRYLACTDEFSDRWAEFSFAAASAHNDEMQALYRKAAEIEKTKL